MKKQCVMFLIAAAFAFVDSACAASPPEPEALVERAIVRLSTLKEFSLQIDRSAVRIPLDGKVSSVHRLAQMSFRAPGLLWSEELPLWGQRSLSVADGFLLRELQFFDENNPAGTLKESPVKEDETFPVGGHPFARLSPAVYPAFELGKAVQPKVTKLQSRYLGRQTIQGEACDVVEFTFDGWGKSWALTREKYPQAPAEGAETSTFYLRVTDALPLRMEVTEWQSFQVDGQWPNYPNTRVQIDVTYRYGEAASAESFTAARFEAAMRGANGNRTPLRDEKK